MNLLYVLVAKKKSRIYSVALAYLYNQDTSSSLLHHKHILYGKINTTIVMKEDDQTTLTEPLLDGADDESKIPELNPEDPLSGLTDEQVKQSLATFGKNEVSIIKLYRTINIGGCTCISHAAM